MSEIKQRYPYPGWQVNKGESKEEWIERMLKTHEYNEYTDTGNIQDMIKLYGTIMYKENYVLSNGKEWSE